MQRSLERYPWALLSEREHAESLAILTPEKAWTVTMEQGGRLPGPTASDVYVALAELSRHQPSSDGFVATSKPELLRLMRRAVGGSPYAAVERALDELTRVRITPVGTWVDDDTFGILTAEVKQQRVCVQWSAAVLRAMIRKRPLDTATYWSLTSPVARRLYRYVDYRRWKGTTQQRDVRLSLAALAKELPILEEYPSVIKRCLEPAHTELQQRGVLAGATFYAVNVAWKAKPEWWVRYTLPMRATTMDRQVPLPVVRDDVSLMVQDIVDVLRDEHSIGFYTSCARHLPHDVIRNVLGEYKHAVRRSEISLDAARKMFTATIVSRARAMNVNLTK